MTNFRNALWFTAGLLLSANVFLYTLNHTAQVLAAWSYSGDQLANMRTHPMQRSVR